MYNILVVEDTAVVRKILENLIGSNPFFRCVSCKDFASVHEVMKQNVDFLAAVVDLNLPDAPNGEVVEEVLRHRIPTVVLTGSVDEPLRASLLAQGVLDYITKDASYSYRQVVKILERLRKNLSIKVLVVEDSLVCSNIMCNLLRKALIEVVVAKNGVEALRVLEKEPDIKMVISDHYMPEMSGFELVRQLREQPQYQNLTIIGVSAQGDPVMSAKFIKSGANDFLTKPFYQEEFYWRVFSALESMEMMEAIHKAVYVDVLTGIHNRRYLFEQGEKLFIEKHKFAGFGVCMFDLDEFKEVNDSLGHLIGDQLIAQFAGILKKTFADDLLGRYGGEEFVVISTRSEEALRKDIANFMYTVRCTLFTEKNLAMTCSVGVCFEPMASLNESLGAADAQLYQAKAFGRNRVEPYDSEVA
ncbi:response regulator [Marinomonas fungiae]|uniref:response regulator n=1 Tax=Marinomonas fungiae TaxID=1137284 RepID=UPI003A8E4B00